MQPNRPLSARERIARDSFAEAIEALNALHEPLHHQDPPLRREFWENMARVLNPNDVDFVIRKSNPAEGRKFRRRQVAVYRKYIETVERDFLALRTKVIAISTRTGEWDIFRDKDLQLRATWLFFRMRLASMVYLAHSRTGERISHAAIAEMRLLLNPA